ncbi:hypothetical protein K9M16_01870 [Candidatus Babeliales bacterium]|nr:hypothetical protein [Candidatus Babeliales bacterium]
MKKKILFFIFIFFFIFCSKILPKSILDGTTNIQYISDHLIFHDEGTDGYYMAQGFVRLNNGFSVLPTGTAFLDTFISVSGGIDLKRTGQIELLSNLTLDANVTLSSGGKINGRGNAIFLEGNLTIPDYSVLNFCGDTIIDGNGNELIIGDAAQLTIDMNKTLTLRNLTLKNTYSTFVYAVPPIRPYATNSKVAFDNVRIEMAQDFLFTQGQFFIHNDVEISGTYKFSYKSTQPSFITKNAQLYFDKDSTFEFYPSTTYNNLIIFQNSASSLYLDGCTLKTTNTGMRLAGGRFFLDNQVTLTTISLDLSDGRYSSESYSSLSTSRSATWHPSGRFLAYTSFGTIRLLNLRGTNLSLAQSITDSPDDNVASAWHPSGNFLAVASLGGGIKLYSFDGLLLTRIASVSTDDTPWGLAWNPDGRFLVATNDANNQNRLYQFKGQTLTQVQEFMDSGIVCWNASWTSDGKYLAIGTSGREEVYEFNGSTLEFICTNGFSNLESHVSWHPNKNLLLSTDEGVSHLYYFNGSSLNLTYTLPREQNDAGISPWSPDGHFCALTKNGYNELFRLNGLTLDQILALEPNGSSWQITWHPNENLIFRANDGSDSVLYNMKYLYSPNLPAINNSLVLGNSTLNQTLDTQILGNANVILKGSIFFDEN